MRPIVYNRRKRFSRDCSLVLDLPLYELDGSSFMSRDAYGHLCTVTGALWTPQGRTFVAASGQKITTTFVTVYPTMTIGVWLKTASNYDVCSKWGAGGQRSYAILVNGGKADFQFSLDGTNATNIAGNTTVSDNTWRFITATHSGLLASIYVNGASDKTPIASASPIFAGNTAFGIGLSQFIGYFEGIIGEVWIYNRALTAGEIMKNYLATKWMYN